MLQQSLSQVGLAGDDELDFEKLVVISFGTKIVSNRTRMRQRLNAVTTAAATAGRSMAVATDRGRRYLHRNKKLVANLAQILLVPTFTTMKELRRVFKAKQCRAGDTQIHHNSAIRKGTSIALNSAEIKILRTNTKTRCRELSHEIISYLIELLLQCVMWNYPQPMDSHGLVPSHPLGRRNHYSYYF